VFDWGNDDDDGDGDGDSCDMQAANAVAAL